MISPRNSRAPGSGAPAPTCAGSGPTVRVVVVDDHLLVRWATRRQLECIPNLRVVGEAADGFEAVALTRTLVPDLVCMDICMPGLDGIEATRRIRAELPQVRVLILSSQEADAVRRAAAAAGAHGYVSKSDGAQRLAAAVQAVLGSGERPSSAQRPS
jgi:DNA-binding NarL/FixJ family response regulator